MPLGSNTKDAVGVNTGLYELASGPEVSGYYDAVMRQRLLPSGRVRHLPMHDYKGDGHVKALLSGAEHHIIVRKKIVDATYFGTSVPSTHVPRFSVAPAVRLVTPNALPQLWMEQGNMPSRFVIIGAGKTAMDVGVWLLASGADPAAIHWVMPRDSWLLNRLRTQPGIEFFKETIGGQAAQMEAFAQAETVDDIFLRLEAADVALRIYPDVKPSMFHYATISKGEVAELQRITHVIRMGRVQAIDDAGMTLDQGHIAMPAAKTLYIDCTASAVDPRPAKPIFDGNVITPQLVRVPQPAFSAAVIAYVEAHYEDDAKKNSVCQTVPFPHDMRDYPASNIANMMNQMAWMQERELGKWIRNCRLDGFGKVIAAVSADDTEKQEILARFRNNAMAAVGNLQRLASLACGA
jgi:hypothetical protein